MTTTIGQAIKQLREQEKLSQAELAQQLGVSRQTISNWENDRTVPALDYMKELADVHQVPLENLLQGNLSKERESHLRYPRLYLLTLLFIPILLTVTPSSLVIFVLLFLLLVVFFLVCDLSKIIIEKVALWKNQRSRS